MSYGEGLLSYAYVAQRGVAAGDAVRELVGDGVAPHVAALEQQALGHAAASFRPAGRGSWCCRRSPARLAAPRADGRIDLEQVDRVAGGGQAVMRVALVAMALASAPACPCASCVAVVASLWLPIAGRDDGQRRLAGQPPKS